MAITVTCTCGKHLRVKDEFAGKKGRCKTCGSVLHIPDIPPVGMDNPFINPLWEKTATVETAPDELPLPEAVDLVAKPETPPTKTCQFCGEEILAVARKCKHCGEFLDQSLRQVSNSPKWNPGVAALMSLILPGLGQLYKRQVGFGILHIIGILFAYGSNIYLGICLHLSSVLHAALSNPRNKSETAQATRTPHGPLHQRNSDRSNGNLGWILLLGIPVTLAVFYIAWGMREESRKRAQEAESRIIQMQLQQSLDRALR